MIEPEGTASGETEVPEEAQVSEESQEAQASEMSEEAAEAQANLSLDVEGVDVDTIMKQIGRRVEERREQGVYKDVALLDLEEQRGETEVSLDPLHELIFLNQLARQYADVTSNYPIGARHSILGPFILLFKKSHQALHDPLYGCLIRQAAGVQRPMRAFNGYFPGDDQARARARLSRRSRPLYLVGGNGIHGRQHRAVARGL